MEGNWVVIRNSLDCELARSFVPRDDDLDEGVQKFLRDITFCPGDKVTIEEGWSE